MTRPLPLTVAVLSLVAWQQPIFRTGTELVRVDALVTRDGVPVTGLTASDFEVRDQGHRQDISAFGAIEAVTAVIALDSSGSMAGDHLPKARAAALVLLGELRADESGTVMAFASQVIRLVEPHTPLDRASAELNRLVPAGATELVDAACASIITVATVPGPKLLVLLSDGRNNASWLQGRDVIDAARRHEVVIYGVSVGRSPSPLSQPRARRGLFGDWTLDPGVTAHQSLDDADRLLRKLGRETGGRTS
jgi:VWFA-related protein